MSSAKVSVWGKTVGFISWDEKKQTSVFELDDEYKNASYNLSPIIDSEKDSIQLGIDYSSGFEGMIPMLNDSLPDSFGNKVFLEWLNSTDIDKSELNPVERLLYVGQRGMGALEYEIGHDIPMLSSDININELADVSDKILKGKLDADAVETGHALRNILSYGSSAVGGAQAKVLLAEVNEGRFLPGDILHKDVDDYYVVKLTTDLENPWLREKNKVELTYNEIARSVGINVAASKLISEGEHHHFASKRFDRVGRKKIHMQTANALSGFYEKKQAFSYENLFRIVDGLGMPYQDKEQLFKQMVFNVAGANRDDHTKNFSFVLPKDGQWRLSKAYDVTFPTNPYESYFRAHQITINGKRTKIDLMDLLAVGRKVGINKPKSIVKDISAAIKSFPGKAKANDISNETISRISDELKTTLSLIKDKGISK